MLKLLSLLLLTLPLSAYQYSLLPMEEGRSAHILRVDAGEELVIVKAEGRETVSMLALRHQALAAVNGGFFKEDGEPAGALKIKGKWLGEVHLPRGVIGWDHERFAIGRWECKEEWDHFPNLIQGVPLLIQNGSPVWDYTPERITNPTFIGDRHTRTAIGLIDGCPILVVVDGATLAELTILMLGLGCSDALNLDGGSSSTMVIDGVSLRAEQERSVGDAILVK